MKNKNNNEVFQSFAMVMQFGINMIVPILACTLFGAWLGEKTGISWLALPLFAMGALAGMRNVFVFARRIYQPGKANRNTHQSADHKTDDYKNGETDVKKTQ